MLMSHWLFGKGTSVTPDRLLLCHGAQRLLVAIAALLRRTLDFGRAGHLD